MPKKESKPKVKITGKASTSGGAGANYGKSMKFNAFGQPMTVKDAPAKPGKKASPKKNSPSLASQAGKVAGKVAGKAAGLAKSKVKADLKIANTAAGVAKKVAGKAAGMAKSKVKADIKAAKTVAGFVAKQAMPPSSNPILKGAKAVGKALAKEVRPKRNFKQVGSLKNLMNNKNIKKK
jgi:hypothetical protein